MNKIDDKTLLELKHGKITALEVVYHRYVGKIFNFIVAITKDSDTAQDLTQDVFLHIWDKRANIDNTNNFEGYIYQIAKHIVYRHLQRNLLLQNYLDKINTTSAGTSAAGKSHTDIEQQIESSMLEEYILKLAARLPKARRKIFFLYWKKNMSYREIATLLSISEKTVATQIARSLHFLRDHLKGIISIATFCLLGNLMC